MMKCLKKPSLLFILIFSALTISAQNNEIQKIINFADTQLELQNYESAIKEYQRAMFFDINYEQAYVLEQIAQCFVQTNDLQRAATFYDKAFFVHKTDSLKNEAVFKKASCYLYAGNYNLSLIELYSLDKNVSTYFKQKKHFFLGMAFFGLEQFYESQKHFTASIDSCYTDEIKEINAVFIKKNLNYPNPQLALVFSLLVPGSGQLYCGEVLEGINSLALTSGLLALGIHVKQQYSFFDALISTGPWFLRYYQGGYQKAEHLAEIKRSKRRTIIFQEILAIIAATKNK